MTITSSHGISAGGFRIDSPHPLGAARPRVGIIAGAGDYPLVIAHGLKRQGYSVHCLGIKDHADERLQAACDGFTTIGLGKFGGAVRYFKKSGVKVATMAGKIHKVRIFERGGWRRHWPDWTGFWELIPHFLSKKKDNRDDSFARTLVQLFARHGIRFTSPTDYLPELLVNYGKLTARGPTNRQTKDIEFAWRLAKEIGRLDVGQTVVVKDGAPIAIEAIEGTDECIRRAGQLCTSGGFVVVKVAKPQQDMRFDAPTIGRGTIETIVQSGGRILAIEAGKTVIVNEPDVVQYANRHGLVIVALEKDGQCQPELMEAAA